jgi:ketosteroid isomerase-like protein
VALNDRIALASPLIALLASCASIAAADLSRADVAAIESSREAFRAAVLARDFDELASLYTDDAILLPPNMPEIRGRAEIRAHFEEFPPLGALTVRFEEVSGSGGVAYVRGSYTMTIAVEGGESIEERGKFLEVRLRQSDGSWPIARDMYSSDLAAEGAEHH